MNTSLDPQVEAGDRQPGELRHLREPGRKLWLTLALALPALAVAPAALHAQTAGSLDLSFAPDVTGPSLSATAVQPDGKIVLAGGFSGVDGQTRNRIARLLADGTVETTATFNPGTGTGIYSTSSAAVQADGKIIVVGQFPTMNGQPRNKIARLLADGTVESTATFNPGTGANLLVNCVAVQADGKILIGGKFTSVNGQTRNGIARLLTDGTVESTATFNPGTGASTGGGPGAEANVYSVVVQADGKILIGGDFTTVNGQPRHGIARLLADGTVESTATFDPGTGVGRDDAAIPQIQSLAVQADGKILIGGSFTSVNGQPRTGMARLLADGTVESTATFNPATVTSGPRSMVVQADGKILIGGQFGIARLLADGTVEGTATFNPGTGVGGGGGFVFSVAVQADGKILIGGPFTSVDGQTRNKIARLANDAAIQSLILSNNARVQWLRSGAAPEVEQVTFEVSTNGGANWSLPGPGTRITGGWELTGLSLTGSGFIRARGRTGGGTSSAGLVESVAAFPVAPSLTIARSNAVVIVSWPVSAGGFVLDQSLTVTGGWSQVAFPYDTNAGGINVGMAAPTGNKFYRLRWP